MKLGALKSPYDIRDYKMVSKASGEKEYPETFSLWTTDVKNQGRVNSCVAHVAAEIAEYFEYNQCNEQLKLSPGYIYGTRYEYTGEGMYPRDALKTLKNVGIVDECKFPHNEEVPDIIQLVKECRFNKKELSHYQISSYFRCNSENDIKDALMQCGPVMASIKWFSGNKLENNVLVQGTKLSGYHAVLIYGWDEKGFKFMNSWGKNWGDNGKAILPYDYPRTECWGVTDTKVENHDSISIPERNKFLDFFYKIVNSIVNFFKKLFS